MCCDKIGKKKSTIFFTTFWRISAKIFPIFPGFYQFFVAFVRFSLPKKAEKRRHGGGGFVASFPSIT